MDTEGRSWNFLIGIGLLLIVVFEWTGSNFITQGLFNDGYEKAFLVTYLNTSAFSVYLIPFLIQKLWKKKDADETEDLTRSTRSAYMRLPTEAPMAAVATGRSRSMSFVGSTRTLNAEELHDLPPLTTRETAKLASIFSLFWFIANWAVNASLDYTSVASSTILASMSGFFTLAIGRIFRVETFSLAKLGAVVLSFLGVLLVTLADTEETRPNAPKPANFALLSRTSASSSTTGPESSTHPSTTNPPLGDVLALLSALFYALYVTLLKVRIKDESRIDMQLFFGFVGVFNVAGLWPIGVILHFTGIEPFELPKTSEVWTVIAINMFITLSSDYIYLLAMLKTTPLVVTVGLALTIPLAVIGDWVFLHIGATPQTIVGAVLVVLSFTALGFEGRQEVEEEVSANDDDMFQDDEFEEPQDEEISSRNDDQGERGRSELRRGPSQHSEQFLRPPQAQKRQPPATRFTPTFHLTPLSVMDAQAGQQPPADQNLTDVKSHVCTPNPQRKFKSFREVQQEQRQKRANRTKPPPWIARKLAVFIYAKKLPPPNTETVAGPRYESQAQGDAQHWDGQSATETSIDPYQYDLEHAERHNMQAPDLGSLNEEEPMSRTSSRTGVATQPRVPEPPTNPDQEKTQPKSDTSVTIEPPPDQSDIVPSPSQPAYPPPSSATATAAPDAADQVTELDVFPGVGSAHARTKMSRETDATAVQSSTIGSNTRQLPPFRGFGELRPPATADLPPLANTRQPPRHAMLAEEYRYCQREGFVKPIRAHHCRVCATCVLNFDHHCPWVGHCVGARNRKFFMNFVYWGFVYCAWICITLIILNAQAGSADKGADALELVVISLTGLFALFTLGLSVTHTYLILLNLTTVEDYGIKSMEERENYTLSHMFPWWNLSAKKRTRRAWDEEWGGLRTEGNIWWLGNTRTNWEQVMGKNPWGWIFPIGQSEADGLSYPINPRFTEDGRWRRRSEWPQELR
ncbi:hypothetical protein FRB90_004337 [Tulasnella sp. 427]|nr:hypothetical protein FRB90_004337 [Tulasnella sp. 427]